MFSFRFGARASALLLTALLLASTLRADIWTAQIFDDQVQRLDDESGAVLSGGIANSGTDPAGLTLGPDGNLYVSSQGTGEVLRYELDGSPLGVFATLPLNGGSAAAPSRLQFGPDGNLYVADFNGPNVRVFDSTGTYVSDAATVGVNVGGIAFGRDDALYVGDFSAANIVRVEDGVQTEFIPANSGGLQSPGGLFFLPSGDLLVVDLFGNQILKYDSNGENAEVWATIPPEIPTELPPGAFYASNFPSQVILDPDGNLIVGVLGISNPDFGGADNGALLRYDLDGNLLETIVDGLPPVSDLVWLPAPDAVPGDYDGDGTVLASDFTKWRNDFGKHVAVGGGADGNGNGIVDAADYTIWRDAAGALGAGSAAAAVPEAPTAALAVWGVILSVGAHRRSRRRQRPASRAALR